MVSQVKLIVILLAVFMILMLDGGLNVWIYFVLYLFLFVCASGLGLFDESI
jgi:hypothetical protein